MKTPKINQLHDTVSNPDGITKKKHGGRRERAAVPIKRGIDGDFRE
jgi:hypothetical protein